MKATLSPLLALLLIGCASNYAVRQDIQASAIMFETTADAAYEDVYRCLLDRVPAIRNTPRASIYPDARRAEIAMSVTNLAGQTGWLYLYEIADGGDGRSTVKAYYATERLARAGHEHVQVCAHR